MNYKEKTEKIRNQILTGDSLFELEKISDEFVDCIVSSPPYWNLRDYGKNAYTIWTDNPRCNHDWKNIEIKNPNSSGGKNDKLKVKGKENFQEYTDYKKRTFNYYRCEKCQGEKFQIGLEPTIELFIKHLCRILDECYRVLKSTGQVWLNLGDSYISNSSYTPEGRKGMFDKKCELSQGNLALIPYRVAIEMQSRGWIIRQIINWSKKILYWNSENNCFDTMGSGFPESVKLRPVKNNEIIIFATKQKSNYFFNYDSLKLGQKQESLERLNRGVSSEHKYNLMPEYGGGKGLNKPRENVKKQEQDEISLKIGDRRIPNNFLINPQGQKYLHYALMPSRLVYLCLIHGCPPKVCAECGKPYKKKYNYIKDEDKTRKIEEGWEKDCVCNTKETVKGIVLDPFSGAGTTCAEAKKIFLILLGLKLTRIMLKWQNNEF
jgi:DNA modification methylase